jgi:hypothetical protein
MPSKYEEGFQTQITQIVVIPANAGIQPRRETLDSGFRRNDEHGSGIPMRIQVPAYWHRLLARPLLSPAHCDVFIL